MNQLTCFFVRLVPLKQWFSKWGLSAEAPSNLVEIEILSFYPDLWIRNAGRGVHQSVFYEVLSTLAALSESWGQGVGTIGELKNTECLDPTLFNWDPLWEGLALLLLKFLVLMCSGVESHSPWKNHSSSLLKIANWLLAMWAKLEQRCVTIFMGSN